MKGFYMNVLESAVWWNFLRRGLDVDAAGDSADFDAAAGSPKVCAQGMLVLIFNNDGKIRAYPAGNGFGGEMEACIFRNGDFNTAASGFQMPITVAGRIAGDFDATGSRIGFDVVVGACYHNGAAGGLSF